MNPDSPDADLLIQRYLERKLNDEEAEALLDLLKSDPSIGDRMLGHVRVEALLRSSSEVPEVEPFLFPKPATPTSPWLLAAAAAIVVLVGASVFFRLTPYARNVSLVSANSTPAPSHTEKNSHATAVLARGFSAVWEDGVTLSDGAILERARLKLKSGFARIDFLNGARVLLEGPADLELVSASRAICHSGKLTAEVPPPARGFLIESALVTVRDLGTEFGMKITATSAEVHVFKGEVELPGLAIASLREGQALAVGKGVAPHSIPSDPARFVGVAQSGALQDGRTARCWANWNLLQKRLIADPTLVALFDFEVGSESASLLPNRSTARGAEPATIIGGHRAEGRWPGKAALAFSGVGDRVRLDLPQSFDSVTFSAWVCVHTLEHKHNSLLMSDGFETGEFHWQINEDGPLSVCQPVYVTEHDYYKAVSPPVFGPHNFGQWTHIAVTIDGPGRTIVHYANGRPISRHEQIAEGPPYLLGPANIGNWSGAIDQTPQRNFSGIMDEFIVHSRALSEGEVAELYRLGSPDSPAP